MKKILFLLCGILVCRATLAQPKFFPRNTYLEKWYENRDGRNMEDEARRAMTSKEVKEIMAYWDGVEKDMFSFFHWVDFDRNGCPDLLFNGKVGTKDYVFVWKNLDDSIYLLMLDIPGNIIQANNPEDGMPLSFAVWNQNCCGDKVSYYSRWASVSQSGVTFMEQQEQGLVYNHTLLPDAGYKVEPKARFETKNYASLLRMTPFIDDETYYDGTHNWKGNYVVKYPQGSKGTVFHQIKDKQGVTWYFVRMDNGPGTVLHSDRFLRSEEVKDPHLSYYYGWIHEGNIHILGD